MKRYIYLSASLLSSLFVVSCTPEYDFKPEERITDIKIVVTATATPNVFKLSASQKNIIGLWNLGNGITVKGANEVLAEYPFAGNYPVSLTGYANGGRTNSTSVTVPVMKNNFDLLSDPIYELIAGTIGSDQGKSWVMDSLLYGHMTNLNSANMEGTPNNTAIPVNLAAVPNTRSGELRLGKTIYDDKATFVLSTLSGQSFRYTNNGSSLVTNTGGNAFKDQVFMKASSWSPTSALSCSAIPLPPGFTTTYNSDWQVSCSPPTGMSWLVKKSEGKYQISFPNVANGPGGFLFFALDWLSAYTIRSITENRMVLRKETMSGTGLATKSTREIVIIRQGSPSGLPLASIPEADSYVQ